MNRMELEEEEDDLMPGVSNVSVSIPMRWAWESSWGQF